MIDTNTIDIEEKGNTILTDRKFLNDVFENAGALLIVLDNEGHICRFNKACETLSGYTFEEVQGRFPWETILPPEDAEIIREQTFSALANNPMARQGRYSNYLQSKDGSRYFVEWHNTVLQDENGQMQYMICSGIDISAHQRMQVELLQAREELERQGQRNHAILTTTMDSYGLADMHGHFVDANPAFLELLGFTREELLQLSISDIEANMDPEAIMARFQRIFENGSDRFETRHRRKDGSVIDVEVSASIAEIGGESYVFGFERDLTESKRAEQELRVAKENAEQLARRNSTILHTTLDGFMIVDKQGRIIDVNPAYEEMLGYSREEYLQMRIADIDVLDNHEDVIKRIQRIAENGYERFESTQRHKDGHPVDVEVNVSLMELGDDSFSFAFVRDITARKKAESELLQAKNLAEEASRAKSEFLSRMSHEFRTPLNAILGFSQLMEIEQLSEDQQSFLNEITYAGRHLLHLIEELLDLSRIEAGKMAVEIESISLLPVVQQALAIVQPLIVEKNLTINMDQEDRLVYADNTRLLQVLVNLLNNAAKYNRQGGEIEIRIENQSGHTVRISIRDTGLGISEKDQQRLFTPFERFVANDTAIDGTGIGLVLCRHMISMMKGRIGMSSAQGEGSTFWVELPLSDIDARQDDSHPSHHASPDMDLKTIVYVEDNDANMRLFQALFQRFPKIKLLSASRGDEGLALIKNALPDLVVLDIHLPGLNGFEVLAAMREDPLTRDIPVIGLSAAAMQSDIEDGIKAGLKRYLTKPVDSNLLLSEIDSLLKA